MAFKRLHGRDAFKRATPVYVCANLKCEVHHPGVQKMGADKKLHWTGPPQCRSCGGLAFEWFATTGEANRWAALRLQEKIGAISKLRKQVRFPLMALGPNGLAAHVADYIADFVYIRDGKETVEDHKPRAGMDDVARLKLKWMAAQRGEPVAIYTS